MANGNAANTIVFKKSALAVFLIIYATGVLIYSSSLLAPFYYDDLPIITENPHIRLTRLTWSQLRQVDQGQPNRLRLLPMATFALNYYFHQYQASSYRLINILIHVITGWLVFCLAWQTLRLNGRKPFFISLLAGLLWLTQPTDIQSVTYIVQRMNGLAAMFYLAAFICYIQARTRQIHFARTDGTTILFFAGCGLAGLLGLVSKETTATLPAFIFLYEWFFFQNLDRLWLKRRLRRLALVAVLCGLIAAVYLGGNPWQRIADSYGNKPYTPASRLLTQPRVIIYYLSLLAWPHPDRLTLDYDFPLSKALTEPVTNLAALFALAALILFAILAAKKHRLMSFAVFWFLGNLAIESSVIGLALVFEHRLYLPSIFPAIAATAYLTRHVKPRPLAMAMLAGLITCNGFWTYRRNITWQDRVTFWRDGCAKAPNLISPRNDYGLALAESGDLKAAIVQYKKAIDLSAGKKAPAFNNLGLFYYQTGDLDRAEEQFIKAIQTQPTFAKAFTNLGIIKAERRDLPAAIRLIETAVSLDPFDSTAHNALGKIYYASGRTEEAIRQCRRALQLDPENLDAENNLAAILLGIGRAEEALPHLARVLALSPDHLEANINIGIAYDKLDNPVMAVFHLFRAVFLAPDYPSARAELGLFLLKKDKYDDARTQLEKALALQPVFPKARLGLASVLEKLGKKDEAIAQYRKIITEDPGNVAAKKGLKALQEKNGHTDE